MNSGCPTHGLESDGDTEVSDSDQTLKVVDVTDAKISETGSGNEFEILRGKEMR